ncbi:hypothetical protein KC866_01400 [Patescibacteria group bacterium]|nr:hypothetical protein [Patescibacteria group bacterium]
MHIIGNTVHPSELLQHETKRRAVVKFLFIIILFFGYFSIIAHRYGVQDGILVTAVTWSFFVLCTPIADAGFLLDFPLRLITKIKMLYSEIIVWILAVIINVYVYAVHQEVYQTTKLVSLFKHILEQPFPMWSIIAISAIGTFISIRFGDELIDTVKHHERTYYQKHKHRHRLWIMVFGFILILVLYDFMLKQLGVELPI